MRNFVKKLDDLKGRNRFRNLALPYGVDLTSNDYLGMAQHPELRAAAIMALQDGMDIGAAGSRLLRGHTKAHAELEEYACAHFSSPRTLFFSSGFQANYAILTTLPQRGDTVLYDALVHASMRDGLFASNAGSFKFAHNDVGMLEELLKRQAKDGQNIWIAVESLYSMDGDVAPLEQIYTLAEQYNARIIIDEAHATGVYGDAGRGLAWDLVQAHGYERLVTLHTCGKAIGVAGGLVCASADVIAYLVNAARPFIYSTAPMPLQALCVQKSLEILVLEDGEKRRQKLFALCKKAQKLFGGAGTQIVPVILGADEAALQKASALQSAGFDVRAIRPPTVPEGTARLRLSLSSAISEDILDQVAGHL